MIYHGLLYYMDCARVLFDVAGIPKTARFEISRMFSSDVENDVIYSCHVGPHYLTMVYVLIAKITPFILYAMHNTMP